VCTGERSERERERDGGWGERERKERERERRERLGRELWIPQLSQGLHGLPADIAGEGI
jgi:hypothetical protein